MLPTLCKNFILIIGGNVLSADIHYTYLPGDIALVSNSQAEMPRLYY